MEEIMRWLGDTWYNKARASTNMQMGETYIENLEV